MKITTTQKGWRIKSVKPRNLPKPEITHIETHKNHLPTDWRNRLLKSIYN